ncbi:BON domain-containing protein [Pseudorhodoferax sp.]|uniref:BON domain-containing protein n=1 Tax=Pseudorhodoferax sp. TaxID=1993553 RepID=UPI0039E25C4A
MHTTHERHARLAGALAVGALALGLAACGERVDTAGTAPATEPTVGQRVDAAVQRTEQAAGELREDASRAAQNVERRVDDMAITAAVNASLAKDPDLSAMKIDVDTKSGVVTLTGPAPSEAAKQRATTLVHAVEGVAGVNNNLQVRAG